MASNNNKKLVFFDMDGTLLNSKKVFNPSTIQAIKTLKEQDFIFCIATGRALSEGILDFAKMLDLEDYLVLANGSYVWDIQSEKLTTLGLPLPRTVVQLFYEKALEHKRQLNFYFEDGSIKYYYFGDDQNEDIKDPNFFRVGPIIYNFADPAKIQFDLEKPIIHAGIKAEGSVIRQIYPEVSSLEAMNLTQISNVLDVYIDADPAGISKWNGIQYVQRKLGISNENTFAFGDSGNDILMLQNVGHGIVMGNAEESIKAMFKHVIGDNNSDAIAECLYSIADGSFFKETVNADDTVDKH
ncbi:Cof-type HAD-IIB family hydrolase [Ureaplasma ceti]|uniref:Cof-type HAD-IIB family hydrolase n=1 Tax=Ureaplasma ceti TaxID=3119530 RepID=A0ABP9U6T0_9BACT